MVWPPIPDVPTPPRRRRRLAFRLVGAGMILMLGLVAATVGAFFLYEQDLDNNVGRIGNPFSALPEKSRPKPAPHDATNILLLGSETRISAARNNWVRSAQRTDAIMIAHIPDDRSRVTITSIPRDSWVNIPGHGKNKINAGFGFGGPTLMVQTVESLTGVRIDHVVIVDFEGFQDITDELGGVRVNVAKGTSDERGSLAAGPQMMNGATALNYVRQRTGLPGGDLDRVKRQQNWIRAVGLKTLNKGTLTSPRKLSGVLGSLTNSIAADDGFTIGRMRSLAISLRGVRGDDLTFLTAPVLTPPVTAAKAASTRPASADKQPAVRLDVAANRELWKAVANDTIDEWLAAHPNAALGQTVR
jgi:LCP family protein required for cell wall assembly